MHEHTHAGSARTTGVAFMRSRAFRRHKAHAKMWRRLKEDRNQHYDDLTCACHSKGKAMAQFREQPKLQQCYCCSSSRYNPWLSREERLTMQELRAECEYEESV